MQIICSQQGSNDSLMICSIARCEADLIQTQSVGGRSDSLSETAQKLIMSIQVCRDIQSARLEKQSEVHCYLCQRAEDFQYGCQMVSYVTRKPSAARGHTSNMKHILFRDGGLIRLPVFLLIRG